MLRAFAFRKERLTCKLVNNTMVLYKMLHFHKFVQCQALPLVGYEKFGIYVATEGLYINISMIFIPSITKMT